jgi:predicted nucleotidyltransferase
MAEAEMAAYRATARRRQAQEEQALARRRERAWKLAQRAMHLLREQFGATRVIVFGSLAHEKAFTPWSDVDIAAWGIHPEDTWRSVGAVMDLDAEITVSLVDVSMARASLLATIEQEGLEL